MTITNGSGECIPKNLNIESLNDIQPYFETLIEKKINSLNDLISLIQSYSDVLSVFSENYSWGFVRMTCNTSNTDFQKRYEMLAGQVFPQIKKYQEQIHQKVLTSPYASSLDEKRYGLLLKKFKNKTQMFSENNVALEAELAPLESQYRQIAGGLSVDINGENLTLQQAALHLNRENRDERKTAWTAIQNARLNVKTELDALFDRMLKLRNQIAINAGFANYRDYMHQEKERFDYTPKDCFDFHNSVQTHVVPLFNRISQKKQASLNLAEDDFKPWDQDGTAANTKPLVPFKQASELLEKGLMVFDKLDVKLSANLRKMKEHNLFDLESRKAKAPGGYNCYLEITGMPFIFMNAAGDQREVVTLMHECGHATHNFLSNHDPLYFYREFPTEMAETASMSMELMTMQHWQIYYSTKEEFKRAQIEQLEGIVSRLPWIAAVDKFQHWIYLNPEHSSSERDNYFLSLMQEFGPKNINWHGLETEQMNIWQKQLHIFEIPFYYIEYGIAQIGALQVYKNFKKDPVWALESYKNGLKLGGSQPLPKLWKAMNINFDFSSETIRDLMVFVEQELEQLYES